MVRCSRYSFLYRLNGFFMPHFAIAAELTEDYHQRNIVFGCRHAGWLAGCG